MNDKRENLGVLDAANAEMADAHSSPEPTEVGVEPVELDSESREFNPYAFSTMTVPPDLRLEMLQAKLPRLDPEYFHDTIPPNQLLDIPLALEDAPTPPPARARIKVVVAFLIGVGVVIAFAIPRLLRDHSSLPRRQRPEATTSSALPLIGASAASSAGQDRVPVPGLGTSAPSVASGPTSSPNHPNHAQTPKLTHAGGTSSPPASTPPLQTSWLKPR